MVKISLFLSLVLSGFLSVSAITIVKSLEAHAVIVLKENPTTVAQMAARELQYHLKLITGVEIPVTNKSGDSRNKIFIGEEWQAHLNFKNQEHAVIFEGDNLYLTGKDVESTGVFSLKDIVSYPCLFENHGSLNAVYDFLEKYCGFRWYLPTEMGIAYEKKPDLTIGGKNIRRIPSTEHRSLNYNYRLPKDLITDTGKDAFDPGTLDWSEQQLWLFRQRIGGRKYVANHSLAAAYLPGAVKAHPEWFKIAKHAGNAELFNFTDSRVPKQICFSNADFRNYYIGLIDQYFKKSYNNNGCNAPCNNISHKVDGENSIVGRGDCVSITPDDFNPECCEACAKLKDTSEKAAASGLFLKGIYTPLVWTIVNNYAKEIKRIHPEAVVSALAYQGYAHVPAFEIEDNVVPMLTLGIRNTYSIQTQQHEAALFDAWIAKMGDRKLYVWLYYNFPIWNANFGKYRSFPGFTAKKIGNRVKGMIQKGLDGIFMESGEFGPYYRDIAMSHLEEYITWRIADDVTLDPNQLFDEFFVRFYGKAAKPMRELYEYITAIYENPGNYPDQPFVHQDESIAWGRLGTPDRMKEIEEMLKKAELAAITNLEKQRVAFFRKNIWEYMKKGATAFRGNKLNSMVSDFSRNDSNLADNTGNTNFRQDHDRSNCAKIENGLLWISYGGIATKPGFDLGEKEKLVLEIVFADSMDCECLQLAFTGNVNKDVLGDEYLVRVGLHNTNSTNILMNFAQSIGEKNKQIGGEIKKISSETNIPQKDWKVWLEMDSINVRFYLNSRDNLILEFAHNQDLKKWLNGIHAAVYCGGKVGDYSKALKISKFNVLKERE